MEDVNGILCDTCTWALSGRSLLSRIMPTKSYARSHYKDYQAFIASKKSGCFLCNWLWAAHTPPPENEGAGKEKRFHVDCTVFSGSNFSVYFNLWVSCSWARDRNFDSMLDDTVFFLPFLPHTEGY